MERKVINISKETHDILKKYCVKHLLKMHPLVDRIIRNYLEKQKEDK